MSTKEILMATFGTKGDLNPFLGLAKYLKKAGHQVTLLSNEFYAKDAQEVGINFVSTGSTAQYDSGVAPSKDFKSMEDYSHSIGDNIRRPMLANEYDYIKSKFENNKNILVILARYDSGAYIACEQLNIPFVRICLSPAHLRTTKPVPEQYKIRQRKSYDIKLTNEFRKEYGLSEIIDFQYFDDKPLLNIAMFPEWFADLNEEEDYSDTRFTNFPLFDIANNENEQKIDDHIKKYGSPIIFMMDSCIAGDKNFFLKSIQICQAFFYPGIFVSHDKESIPENLPEDIIAVDFINMESTLQRASLLVHTGGIGTCARAMQATIPQLVIPRYDDNDHPTNGLKIALFGSGGCINRSEYSVDELPKIIYNITQKEKLKGMREQIKKSIDSIDGLEETCSIISSL